MMRVPDDSFTLLSGVGQLRSTWNGRENRSLRQIKFKFQIAAITETIKMPVAEFIPYKKRRLNMSNGEDGIEIKSRIAICVKSENK